jgi:hypothetical protein
MEKIPHPVVMFGSSTIPRSAGAWILLRQASPGAIWSNFRRFQALGSSRRSGLRADAEPSYCRLSDHVD